MKHFLYLPAVAVAGVLSASLSGPAQAIVGGTNTNDFMVVGNGVQITANWVLTARHLGLLAGGSFSNGFGSSSIAAVYNAASGVFPIDDLTLLRLDNAIAGAPQMSLSSTLLAPTTALDVAVTLVTDNVQTPRGFAHAQWREVVTTIDDDNDINTPEVQVNWLVMYDNSYGVPYVQGGDSGGGLFLGHVTDHSSPLLGIASAQLSDITGPNSNTFASAYVQLAPYRNWIDSVMALDLSDGQTALWVATPVPEAATWAMWAAGLAGLVGTVRRTSGQRPRRPGAHHSST